MITACALAMSLTAVDYLQTRAILDSNGRWKEGNPVISQRNVNEYFIGAALLETFLCVEGSKHSENVLWMVTGVQLQAVANNYALGVRVEF